MNEAVRDCLVTGYEDLIESLFLPDPDDRHVLAAAIRADAEVIVTFNLKDFPAGTLASYNVEAMHPDDYLVSLFDAAPGHSVRRSSDNGKDCVAHRRRPMNCSVPLKVRGCRKRLPVFASSPICCDRLRKNSHPPLVFPEHGLATLNPASDYHCPAWFEFFVFCDNCRFLAVAYAAAITSRFVAPPTPQRRGKKILTVSSCPDLIGNEALRRERQGLSH